MKQKDGLLFYGWVIAVMILYILMLGKRGGLW